MSIPFKLTVLGLCVCLTVPAFVGCEEKGPAEKAGEKIDKSIKEAGEAMEDAGEKIKENLE